MPTSMKTVMPYYPDDMILFEEDGRAVIEFFLDPDGNVLAPSPLSATNDQTADAAIAALTEWKFEPPRKNGKRVYARMIQPFAFHYKGENPPESSKDSSTQSTESRLAPWACPQWAAARMIQVATPWRC